MNQIKHLAAIAALVLIVGCASQSKTTYNTLASVQIATAGAYSAYLDLVIQGKLATNSVPIISQDYTVFQSVWNSAVRVASLGVQAPPTAPVIATAAKVTTDIAVAKGAK